MVRSYLKPGTERWDKLVAVAALNLCRDWDALMSAVQGYLYRNKWRIGKQRYDAEERVQDFVFDLLGFIIEKPLTR